MCDRRGFLITFEGIQGLGKQVRMLTSFADKHDVPCATIEAIDPSNRRTLDEMLGYLDRGVSVVCRGYITSMSRTSARSKAKIHNEWPTPDMVVSLSDAVGYMARRAIGARGVMGVDYVEYSEVYLRLSHKWGGYLKEYRRAIEIAQAERKLEYSLSEDSRHIHMQILGEIAKVYELK